MDKKLLDLLACPLTHQPLKRLDAAQLQHLNAAIAANGLTFGEHRQTEALREALITADGRYVYRVDEGIPVLLPETALATQSLPGFPA